MTRSSNGPRALSLAAACPTVLPSVLATALATALTAALATACSAPPGPPPYDDSLAPPPDAAASCSPVAELTRQHDVTTNAFLVDLDEGRSCEIFLEQDECILAIFRDCTYPTLGERQWVGSATTDGNAVRVSLAPQFSKAPAQAPPRQCVGTLASPDDPRAGVMLTCDGSDPARRLYLERKDFSVKRFGERRPLEQLSLGSFGTIDALPDMTRVAHDQTSDIWLVVNWSGGTAGGGVYRVTGEPEIPRLELADPVTRPRVLSSSPEGLVLVGVGDEMVENMTLRAYDASSPSARTSLVTTTTTADAVYAIAGGAGDRFLVASRPRAGTGHVARLYSYDRAGRRLRREPVTFVAGSDYLIQAVSWSRAAGGADAAEFAIAMTHDASDEGVVVGVDANLRELWRTPANTKFDVRAMASLTGRGRVAVILAGGERDYEGPDQSNHYYEIDASTGQVGPVVAIPFADTEDLSYDEVRDRVYISQRFGTIGYVERQPTPRAAQGFFKLDKVDERTDVFITAMVWDEARQRVVIADPRRSVLDSIRLVAP